MRIAGIVVTLGVAAALGGCGSIYNMGVPLSQAGRPAAAYRTVDVPPAPPGADGEASGAAERRHTAHEGAHGGGRTASVRSASTRAERRPSVDPDLKPFTPEWWEQERRADAKLRDSIRICSNCLKPQKPDPLDAVAGSSQTAPDAAAGSATGSVGRARAGGPQNPAPSVAPTSGTAPAHDGTSGTSAH